MLSFQICFFSEDIWVKVWLQRYKYMLHHWFQKSLPVIVLYMSDALNWITGFSMTRNPIAGVPCFRHLFFLTIAQARCGHCSDTNSIGNLRVGEQIGNNFAVPDWVWFLQAPTVKLKQMPKQSMLLILLLLPKYFYFLLDPMSS